MNWRVLKFVAAVELLTSLNLYTLAPTDGVRVWYPSGWAYVGEHGLVSVGVFAALFWTLHKLLRGKLRSDVLTAVAGIGGELISTAYVWFVIPSSGEVSRSWYTARFADYFSARMTTWCVLAALSAIVYLILYLRRWRFENTSRRNIPVDD